MQNYAVFGGVFVGLYYVIKCNHIQDSSKELTSIFSLIKKGSGVADSRNCFMFGIDIPFQ